MAACLWSADEARTLCLRPFVFPALFAATRPARLFVITSLDKKIGMVQHARYPGCQPGCRRAASPRRFGDKDSLTMSRRKNTHCCLPRTMAGLTPLISYL